MIEVEKKFLLDGAQMKNLLDGAKLISKKSFQDTYYDTADYSLTSKDYWLRQRDSKWELKVPLQKTALSLNHTNIYNELEDIDLIIKELKLDPALKFEDSLKKAGISGFITVITNRASYEKDGFHIDIDEATYKGSDFKYAVSEIELLVESEDEIDSAEKKIVEFARGIGLTVDKVIYGKVLAYLESESKAHYQALVQAKVSKVR